MDMVLTDSARRFRPNWTASLLRASAEARAKVVFCSRRISIISAVQLAASPIGFAQGLPRRLLGVSDGTTALTGVRAGVAAG